MRCAVALAAVLVAGCVGERVADDGLPRLDWREMRAAAVAGPAVLERFVTGTTSVTPLTGGSRVEYLRADGALVVWLTGRTEAARGTWRVEPNRDGRGQLCREAPAAGLAGCVGPGSIETAFYETVRGDPLGLADGVPPVGYRPVPGWQSLARLIAAIRPAS